ncbi:N(G),N(G)-dimethylarginine dimethylaminohydrolase [Clostridium sp. D2Q-14]|uniref:dimethylarginine dimethylaminohydrolase family protein n=1 Tax=Anaeromonas gelatinilytica TaxID=2683194 RepID=UPI00193B66DB|nr:arginine deiminase family protein [Anaeromonas gelatinilytica]MBS4535004.1 N(G),N(G)-dimethylarginine dimethylaminohydrolase [Anaeromonas gelatinilytica]
MFKNVIVRKPSKNMVDGITSAPELGKPDFELALKQHENYINALKSCGVKVTKLDVNDRYPDSCFVEDVAVLNRKCAIITNPGAESRKGEEKEIIDEIKKFYPEDKIEYIKAPGTLEGGDVMMVGDHFYVGLSDRTNQDGIDQFIKILDKYKLTGSAVEMKEFLHLKTGVAYLENNNLLVSGEFIEHPDFKDFNRIIIDDDEQYASNSIWVNEKVIVPEGYEKAKKSIEDAGYEVIVVDTSEYRKLDGGLSCLSLRF